MKDLNELMQAILEMDAKQRQAADDAMEERRKELAALANEQTMLAQDAGSRSDFEASACSRSASEIPISDSR